jgi:hypothetical protein
VEAARSEQEKIEAASGQSIRGVRMHWLYFSPRTPAVLRQAGILYDSSFGYNDAVGFRPGTGQPFCFPESGLLELSLIIQDTALFFPGRMNLKPNDASVLCHQLISSLLRFGGVLTVNWHDRSLAPERLWDTFYAQLLEELENNRVWFATGFQAASWYMGRRSITFKPECARFARPRRVMIESRHPIVPPAVVRTYLPHGGRDLSRPYRDTVFDGRTPLLVGNLN